MTSGITRNPWVIPVVTPKWVNNTNVHSKFTLISLFSKIHSLKSEHIHSFLFREYTAVYPYAYIPTQLLYCMRSPWCIKHMALWENICLEIDFKLSSISYSFPLACNVNCLEVEVLNILKVGYNAVVCNLHRDRDIAIACSIIFRCIVSCFMNVGQVRIFFLNKII